MEFLDEAIIAIQSGDGGRGCISFRRERFIPKGGPDGGDGGKGGDVLIRARKSLFSLSQFRSKKRFQASDGQPGRSKGQSGRNGPDVVIDVPLGTVVEDMDTNEVLADLVLDGEQILLLPGGRGGKGNRHFATSTNRAPRIAQPGRPGVDKQLRLTLKFLADIGLIGFPNAGKSTLLSRLTMARPRIDTYPFTTLTPNLGVMVDDGQCRIVIADIPGLIEGASTGRGLGHQFLRHIERTRLLLYVLDVTHPCKEDLLEDFHALRNELFAYSPELIEKPSVVAVNKMDLYGKEHRDVEAMGQALEKEGMAFYTISALTGQGLDLFQQALREEATGLIGSQEDRSAGSMLTNPGEESQRSRMGKEGKQDQP